MKDFKRQTLRVVLIKLMMLGKCSDNERQETGTHLKNGEHSLSLTGLTILVDWNHLAGTELDDRPGHRGAGYEGSDQELQILENVTDTLNRILRNQ